MLAGIVRDDPEALKEAVFSYEIQADAFVSSGGVSVGERDVVKAAFFKHGDIAFFEGRDAAGHAAGVRVHRGQAVLRAARATR